MDDTGEVMGRWGDVSAPNPVKEEGGSSAGRGPVLHRIVQQVVGTNKKRAKRRAVKKKEFNKR